MDHTIDLYPKSDLREKVAITSENIPKAGRTTIYTSGCPHNQNKFTHNIGLPPPPTVKKCVPNRRSNIPSASATVKIGNDAQMRTEAIKEVHVNIGIFISVMPGALIFKIVTIKLIPV